MADQPSNLPSYDAGHHPSRFDSLPMNHLDLTSGPELNCPPNYEWAEDDEDVAGD